MNEARHSARVGAFVFVAIILVAALLLTFGKGLSVFTPTYILRLRAESAGGLKPRAPVAISGVVVGRVLATELAPEGIGVTILLQIEKRYGIHRDARFVVEQVGLLGDQFVVIYPTSNRAPLLRDGEEVECSAPFNLQEIARSTVGFIQRVDQTIRVLNEAIARLDGSLLSPQTLTNLVVGVGNLKQLSDRANSVVDRLDGIVATNAAPVAVVLTNLVRFTAELNRLTTNLEDTVSENRAALSGTLKSIEQTSGTLRQLAADLQAGKGPAGSLLKDAQLQEYLSNSLANLSVATSNMANYGLLYKPRKPKPAKK